MPSLKIPVLWEVGFRGELPVLLVDWVGWHVQLQHLDSVVVESFAIHPPQPHHPPRRFPAQNMPREPP